MEVYGECAAQTKELEKPIVVGPATCARTRTCVHFVLIGLMFLWCSIVGYTGAMLVVNMLHGSICQVVWCSIEYFPVFFLPLLFSDSTVYKIRYAGMLTHMHVN